MNLITEDMHKKLKQTREEKIALYMTLEKEKIAEMLAEANIHLDYYTGRVGEVKFSMNTDRDSLREEFIQYAYTAKLDYDIHFSKTGRPIVCYPEPRIEDMYSFFQSKLTQSEHREGGMSETRFLIERTDTNQWGVLRLTYSGEHAKPQWYVDANFAAHFETKEDAESALFQYASPVGDYEVIVTEHEFVSPPLTEPVTEDIRKFIDAHEEWEASLIGDNGLWWPYRDEDAIKGEMYDKMLELQEMRNALRSKLQKDESDTTKKEENV